MILFIALALCLLIQQTDQHSKKDTAFIRMIVAVLGIVLWIIYVVIPFAGWPERLIR